MRVLELGKFYPPDQGGMETALRNACRGLVQRGHEVRVLVASSSSRGVSETIDGVVVRRVARHGSLASVPLCPGFLPALRQMRAEFDPDIVHLHLPNPGAAAAWSVLNDDRPLVVTYHSDIVRQRLLAWAWKPWRQRVLARAARVLVTSEAMLRESDTLSSIADRCEVLTLGIDVEWFDAVESADVEACRAEFGSEFFLFVGRLVYYKGLDVLLRAVVGTDMKLVIVGDGPRRRAWEELAAREGLGDRVRFLGPIEDDRLRSIYHACTGLVLPSTAPSEAFGLVQLEAMACRKPVVASRASGGMASIQRDGETGLLVPAEDRDALREALRTLVRDPERASAMGRAGRQRVEEIFDTRHSVLRLEALFREVLQLRAGAAPRRSSP